jgi:magnesium transporter
MEMEHSHNKSAVSVATKAVVTALPEETLAEIETRFRSNVKSLDMLQYVYVLDKNEIIKGVFSIRDIFSNSPDLLAKELMVTPVHHVLPETDQETATTIVLLKKIKAIPVIEKDGKFKGVITSRKIFEILSEEHSEDLLYMGGVQKIYSASDIIKNRLNVLILARLPWLLIGLLGGVLAALAVEGFEDVLKEYIVLAFFLPLVVYMSDAVASQTIAIFIRAMALDHSFSVKRYMVRELSLAFFIALIVGILLFAVSFFWFYSIGLSLVLGVALFLSVLVAVSVALFMTIFLDFIKKDPAVGSGPFATIIIDLVTIFIYFTVAKMFLPLFV